jgi:protein-S-isoprenylcysteine O-methyltransferase Ste14
MTEIADVERADRIGRRRARLFAAQAVLFIGWQGLFFSGPAENPMRTVSAVKLSAWFVWVLALLLLLATGGGLLRHRKLRGLLNDELTRQNRTAAYVTGFWVAVAACVGLYLIEMFEPVSGREAVHIVLSAAIAAGLLTFSMRERRTARGE